MVVRTRYAPSPTGAQHVGGLRTALYNHLFARAHGGKFIVRIEDTDRARFQPGASERILDDLSWIGIVADESPRVGGERAPYVQSERLSLYRKHAEQLISTRRAYWAYDSNEELAELKARGYGYDGRGRTRSAEQNDARRAQGIVGVARFITPSDGESGWNDMILGEVARKHTDLTCDPILLKSDGYPTYHLASVVDDHTMRITHVLRAQEWLSSTPLHLLLYKAFGWEPPTYAHLPPIIGSDGKKLSKRHGATAVSALREAGILPEALCNYIALLGWSYDDSREHFSLADLSTLFAIERVQKSAATFDWQKLQWHNEYYLRQLKNVELLTRICAARAEAEKYAQTDSGNARLTDNDIAHLQKIIRQMIDEKRRDAIEILGEALKQRIHTIAEAYLWMGYLLPTPSSPSPQLLCGKKFSATDAAELLTFVIGLNDDQLIASAAFEAQLRDYCQAHSLSIGHSIGVVRTALSCAKSSLPAQVMLATLPIATIRKRIERAIAILTARS